MTQLILNEMIVFPKNLAFDTKGVQGADGIEVSSPQEFLDGQAVELLKKEKIRRVGLSGTASLLPDRLKFVKQILKGAGIEFYFINNI